MRSRSSGSVAVKVVWRIISDGDEGALDVLHLHQMAAVVVQVAGILRLEGLCQFHVRGDGFKPDGFGMGEVLGRPDSASSAARCSRTAARGPALGHFARIAVGGLRLAAGYQPRAKATAVRSDMSLPPLSQLCCIYFISRDGRSTRRRRSS